jgi:hypothetical protein
VYGTVCVLVAQTWRLEDAAKGDLSNEQLNQPINESKATSLQIDKSTITLASGPRVRRQRETEEGGKQQI